MTARVAAVSRLGLVSDRRRLCVAAGQPLDQAPGLLRAQLEAAAAAGLAFFQLREADLPAAELLVLARHLAAAARGRTRVVVNDRADIAALSGAGVHLKHGSIDAGRLRAWLPAGTWMSQAVHTVADVRAAGPVDAVIAGTAKASASKLPGSPTLGAEGLAAIVTASAVPVFAIGGLQPSDWTWVAATGAFGCAAIGAFLPGPGEGAGAAVERAARAFATVIDGGGGRY